MQWQHGKEYPRIIVLCKTFNGHEFVEVMIESLYNLVSKFVFVNSDVSWTGKRGNTVVPIIDDWRTCSDVFDKIIMLPFDSDNQDAQYNHGLDYINRELDYDLIMVVDTDEIWEKEDVDRAIDFIKVASSKIKVFCCKMHTYIKSPYYRIVPPEICEPTIFIRPGLTKINGPRGCRIKPRVTMPEVFMHHFSYVRDSSESIREKIIASTTADGVSYIDPEKWFHEKWDRLPHITDFHTSKGYETAWKSVKIVTKDDLPSVFKLRDHTLLRQFESESTGYTDRHINGFRVHCTINENTDLSLHQETEEFKLIQRYLENQSKQSKILEVGCLHGRVLLNLARFGYSDLTGIDIVAEAIKYAKNMATEWNVAKRVKFIHGEYPISLPGKPFNTIILFDVLEHVRNISLFLTEMHSSLVDGGQALILTPKGKNYYDSCHLNIFPDMEVYFNVLSQYMKVSEWFEVNGKLFARCVRK